MRVIEQCGVFCFDRILFVLGWWDVPLLILIMIMTKANGSVIVILAENHRRNFLHYLKYELYYCQPETGTKLFLFSGLVQFGT